MSVPEVNRLLILFFIGINVFSFLLFAWDRICQKNKGPRVPEILLFLVSIIGGAFGGWIALLTMRAKRRKKRFKVGLPVLILAQIVVLVILKMGL